MRLLLLTAAAVNIMAVVLGVLTQGVLWPLNVAAGMGCLIMAQLYDEYD